MNSILFKKICSDEKFGDWFALGTQKQWLEIRITKTGRIKVGPLHKEKHIHFTLKVL